ncbi:Maf family protein [Marinicella gelatinilytica]|uniref:Maf family protein n=1 Tax=Marinicella gelatinilytica TaxID=2996017 RepID=UPI002260CB29|nr:nucleoside triphosphate pyrophosphatase [Marinicella gelatinilytica]MCX7545070.1 Maf family protein [Marinicella gelatinilytica]
MNSQYAQKNNKPPVILASSSVYRRHQLQQLHIDFSHYDAAIDESLVEDESPKNRALRLAIAKAQSIKKQFPEAVVIGSDQVCACDNQVYHKPGNRHNNIKHLTAFSGRTVIFYTAVCVMGLNTQSREYINETQVKFRQLSASEISRYVDKEQAFDCAGGFKMEQLGLSLMRSVKSDDPSALMGLPLIQLCAFLRELGVELP